MATKMVSSVQRIRWTEDALVRLKSGRELSGKQIFQSAPEKPVWWKYKLLGALFDMGYLDRIGAIGPSRRYRLNEAARSTFEAFIEDDRAVRDLVFGASTIVTLEKFDLDPEQTDVESVSQEPAPPPDASADLLRSFTEHMARFVTVLETLSERVGKLEAAQERSQALTDQAIGANARVFSLALAAATTALADNAAHERAALAAYINDERVALTEHIRSFENDPRKDSANKRHQSLVERLNIIGEGVEVCASVLAAVGRNSAASDSVRMPNIPLVLASRSGVGK